MTTVILAHPNQHCPRFQVFGIYNSSTTASPSPSRNSMTRNGLNGSPGS